MHAEPTNDHEPPIARDKYPGFCEETLSGWDCCPIEQDGCNCPARRRLEGDSTPVSERPGIGRWARDPQEEGN